MARTLVRFQKLTFVIFPSSQLGQQRISLKKHGFGFMSARALIAGNYFDRRRAMFRNLFILLRYNLLQ